MCNDDFISEYKRNLTTTKRILRFLNPLISKCPKCGVYGVSYTRTDRVGYMNIDVYICDCCGEEFI